MPSRKMVADNAKPSWKLRRRAVFGSLLFCVIIISYIVFVADDKPVYETVVFSAFGLMGAIIASYIGGAVWDDYNMRRSINNSNEGESA